MANAGNTVTMKLSLGVDDRGHAITSATVTDALDEIKKQLTSGATAGQARLTGKHDHLEVVGGECTATTRIRWALDGDLEV